MEWEYIELTLGIEINHPLVNNDMVVEGLHHKLVFAFGEADGHRPSRLCTHYVLFPLL